MLFRWIVWVVSIIDLRFELYILLIVIVVIDEGKLVVNVVCLVGVWLMFVFNIFFMIILLIFDELILVCLRYVEIVIELRCGVVIFLNVFNIVLIGVCVVDKIKVLDMFDFCFCIVKWVILFVLNNLWWIEYGLIGKCLLLLDSK